MEKIILFPIISGIFLIFLLVIFFCYNCMSVWVDGMYDSAAFVENILWSSTLRILPRSTRNPTDRNTVTAPAEIICNQPNISSVEEDQQNQYQRRRSTLV